MHKLFLAVWALSLTATQGLRLMYDCDVMPEVCVNTCYGAKCAGIGNKLFYDDEGPSVRESRRKASGCIASGGNRCSTKKGYAPGYQCDEYPLASTTSRSQVKTRLNRCVPAIQNSRQGGYLAAFYRTQCNSAPCDFDVWVSSAKAIRLPYCSTGCRKTDSNEVIGPGPFKGSLLSNQTEPVVVSNTTFNQQWLTESGRYVVIPGGGVPEIGETAYWVKPKNGTLWGKQLLTAGLDGEDLSNSTRAATLEMLAKEVDLVEDKLVGPA